jgi:hypothetical protein
MEDEARARLDEMTDIKRRRFIDGRDLPRSARFFC